MVRLAYGFISVFLFFFLSGCKQENPLQPDTNSKGHLSLIIDKTNAPEDVAIVTAKLTRPNHTSIIQNLNLLSDTSASITFQAIAAGQWNLQVDAADTNGQVLYTGQAVVNVVANTTANVSLVLQPVPGNTGNIFIYVSWGTWDNGNWIDYIYNPVFQKSQSPTFPNGVMQAKIYKEGNLFKMYFLNLYNSAKTNVGYAESTDGINWNYVHPVPVLDVTPGAWDALAVQSGAIIKIQETYYMYYTGFSNQYNYWHIGLATSSDGKNWIKNNNPILLGNNMEFNIHVDDVIDIGGTYHMYYSIRTNSVWYIGLATSIDGINWSRYSGNPILTKTQTWEGTGVYFPSIIKEGDLYKMIYMNSEQNAFGTASSADGKIWQKNNNNPVFNISNVHNNWTPHILYPHWRKYDNELRIYYSSYFSNTGEYSIGMAKKN
jgi:predicted GH43/DUF377 family glycosyl hydrolase